MNKKLICMTSAVLLTTSLAACGSTPAEPVTMPTVSVTVPAETDPEATLPAAVFEETVLVDDENCTFTITAIENDSIWGYTLKAYLENKTDLDLTFSLNRVSVNGYMCDPLWAATVTAGMKSNESISFSSDSFAANGITNVTDIAFTLDVYDSNDWSADHLVSEVFSLHPMGEDAVQDYPREAQDSDIVLFEDENCAMIVTGFDPDNMWGYTLKVYLENKTDKTLMFSVNDASVNGFMCDPIWAATVAPGKRSNTTISWMKENLEENGITSVENLTLPITVYDSDNWMADYLIDETFTINP